MDILRGAWGMILVLWTLTVIGEALDPYYIPRAKILTRKEVEPKSSDDDFEVSARKCRRIGERAARRRITCVADTQFYETLSNRVHMSRMDKYSERELRDLAFKISKCSKDYAAYFEKGCQVKSKLLTDRIRCRRMPTRRQRAICKGELRRQHR